MFNIASYVKVKNVGARISDLGDGDMGLSSEYSLLKDTHSNRAKALAKSGISIKNTVIAGISHGTHIAVVNQHDASTIISETDGLITFEKNLALAITTADCLPIFFLHANVVAIIHAGWRGLAANIIQEMADSLQGLNVDPRSMHVVIGPHICMKCYEVKEDFLKQFETYKATEKIEGRTCLSLSKIAIAQLRTAGFVHIQDVHVCTYENNFFSARRDGLPLKVQLATIELKNIFKK